MCGDCFLLHGCYTIKNLQRITRGRGSVTVYTVYVEYKDAAIRLVQNIIVRIIILSGAGHLYIVRLETA